VLKVNTNHDGGTIYQIQVSEVAEAQGWDCRRKMVCLWAS